MAKKIIYSSPTPSQNSAYSGGTVLAANTGPSSFNSKPILTPAQTLQNAPSLGMSMIPKGNGTPAVNKGSTPVTPTSNPPQEGFTPEQLDNFRSILGIKDQADPSINLPVNKALNLNYDTEDPNASFNNDYETYLRGEFTQPADREGIRQETLNRYQDQIDAVNRIYDEKLSQARIVGQGRVGQGTAINARRGLAGSARGMGIDEGIRGFNKKEEDTINDERMNAIAMVYGLVDKLSTDEYAARKSAIQEGYKSYVEFLKGKDERKNTAVGNIAAQLFYQGIDPTELDPEELQKIVTKLGTSTGTLMNAYKQYERSENKAAKEMQTVLGEGQTLVDADGNTIATGRNKPVTLGEGDAIVDSNGKVIYKNPKATTSGGLGGMSDEAFKRVGQIADDVRSDPDIKEFITVRDGYNRVTAGAALKNGQGDLSLIFGYMKLLDPNSVVRETEFSNAEQAMGYAQSKLNLPKKFFKGDRLTDEGRQQFIAAAKSIYAQKEANYLDTYDYYAKRALDAGVDPDQVIRDYTGKRAQTVTKQPKTLSEAIAFYPEKKVQITQMIRENPSLSDQDILQILGFKNEGSGSNNADIEKAKVAIAANESAGAKNPYTILSGKPTVREGGRKDYAYGKYQVMGDNIPSWTKQALGYSMTPQQFLANPQAQEKVFEVIFGGYIDKYGSVEDAASVWFTGRPRAEGSNRRDAFGTTGKQYVDKFSRTYRS